MLLFIWICDKRGKVKVKYLPTYSVSHQLKGYKHSRLSSSILYWHVLKCFNTWHICIVSWKVISSKTEINFHRFVPFLYLWSVKSIFYTFNVFERAQEFPIYDIVFFHFLEHLSSFNRIITIHINNQQHVVL